MKCKEKNIILISYIKKGDQLKKVLVKNLTNYKLKK